MNKHKAVIGCQWGDEGKGKIVDLLAAGADIIARFQGGANAGHTIRVGDKKYVLHLIPSGIIHPDKICFIGNGVVLDPFTFKEELQLLENEGIDYQGRLFISPATNLVLPYHKLIDAVDEGNRGTTSIGTTMRGIGPAYIDKVARHGIRLVDIFNPERLRRRLEFNRTMKARYLDGSTDERADLERTFNDLQAMAPMFRPMMVDVSRRLYEANKEGKVILYEGAQGCMLDVDLGTYPFATSSNTTVGGVLTGLGVGPKMVGEVVGVIKAYTTRVGSGPFPTELVDDIGEKIRLLGDEYGATTGRPRRCGWLDLVALRHAVRINGVDSIAVTKLDVLDELAEIKVCVAYKLNGDIFSEVPLDLAELSHVQPIYKTLPGWQADTTGTTEFGNLPQKARDYLKFICEDLGVSICLVSTGARREETIRI
ncbi:MAG: adenylosuccinate synthase [candidate division Zixibacteria bacterium]|nr:adenylosuccinate synthase [candidate division Zixibacteria bacterium]MDD5425479.1 adenylosuccinate synthase [candidate division Zixibacteria bacterium]